MAVRLNLLVKSPESSRESFELPFCFLPSLYSFVCLGYGSPFTLATHATCFLKLSSRYSGLPLLCDSDCWHKPIAQHATIMLFHLICVAAQVSDFFFCWQVCNGNILHCDMLIFFINKTRHHRSHVMLAHTCTATTDSTSTEILLNSSKQPHAPV